MEKKLVLIVLLSVSFECEGHGLLGLDLSALLGGAHKRIQDTVQGVSNTVLGGLTLEFDGNANIDHPQPSQPPNKGGETIVVVVKETSNLDHQHEGPPGPPRHHPHFHHHGPHHHGNFPHHNTYNRPEDFNNNGENENFGNPNQHYGKPHHHQGNYGNSGGYGNYNGNNNNYGRPPNYGQNNYGRPDQNNYGGYDQNSYGRPDQNNYGRPDQNSNERPDENNSGRPDQSNYGRPDQNDNGIPDQNNYGRPDQNNHEPPSQNVPDTNGDVTQNNNNKPNYNHQPKPANPHNIGNQNQDESTNDGGSNIPDKTTWGTIHGQEQTTNSPAKPDSPLLVPLNPNEYVYEGDKIDVNAPKRETDNKKEEDESLGIDIRGLE